MPVVLRWKQKLFMEEELINILCASQFADTIINLFHVYSLLLPYKINANFAQLIKYTCFYYLCFGYHLKHSHNNNNMQNTAYNNPAQEQPTNSCQIFGIAGVIVQIVLGFLSFSVLVLKRYRQHPKRPWKIWAMDTSKQGVSQLIAHFLNVAISLVMSHHLANDACIWYFITNVLDNTVGVFICCGVLRLIEGGIISGRCEQYRSGNYYDIVEYEEDRATSAYARFDGSVNMANRQSHLNEGQLEVGEGGCEGGRQGQEQEQEQEKNNNIHKQSIISSVSSYSSPLPPSSFLPPLQISSRKQIILISYFAWFIQFLIWNTIVAVCKSLLFCLEMALNHPLNSISQFLLGWVQPYPTLELVMVIIIIPVFMNGLAFWIQDNFLKKKEGAEGLGESAQYKQPLI